MTIKPDILVVMDVEGGLLRFASKRRGSGEPRRLKYYWFGVAPIT
jgi:hypothetical protein